VGCQAHPAVPYAPAYSAGTARHWVDVDDVWVDVDWEGFDRGAMGLKSKRMRPRSAGSTAFTRSGREPLGSRNKKKKQNSKLNLHFNNFPKDFFGKSI